MRLVAKIGTSSITDALGVIDESVVDSLCDQLARCAPTGHEVILVSVRRRVGRRCRAGHVGAADRHADAASDLRCGSEPVDGHVQPLARSPRSGRRAGAAGAQRLRRSTSVPARPPDAGAADRARVHSRSSTRTTRSPATSSATATTIASPRSSPTTSTPICWCCSPTRPACTPPTRATMPTPN